jgi:hypothetical protein
MGRNKLLRCLKNVIMPNKNDKAVEIPLGPQIIIFTQLKLLYSHIIIFTHIDLNLDLK